MLEMLAESLKPRGQSLIVANLKGPALKCLTNAGAPSVLKKHGSHLCIDMDQALAIIRGEDKDGSVSQQDVQALVKRVDTAQFMIKSANKSAFYACKPPQEFCSKGASAQPTATPSTPGVAQAEAPCDSV